MNTNALLTPVFTAYMFFIVAIMVFVLLPLIPRPEIHPMGLNSTHVDNVTCRYTWLGGTDYDSFVENLTVDEKLVGHPMAGSVIHTGNCSAKVCMYMKDVRKYVQMYPKAYGEC